MHGRKSHRIVARGIEALCNLEHLGAAGAEVNSGDAPASSCRCPTGSCRPSRTSSCGRPSADTTHIGFLTQDKAEAAAETIRHAGKSGAA